MNAFLFFSSFQMLELFHNLEEMIVYVYCMIWTCIVLLKLLVLSASTPGDVFYFVPNKGGASAPLYVGFRIDVE